MLHASNASTADAAEQKTARVCYSGANHNNQNTYCTSPNVAHTEREGKYESVAGFYSFTAMGTKELKTVSYAL